MRAGKYQSALSDKDVNWPYVHSPDDEKAHDSNWATFFHKSPVMLLSVILLFSCQWGLTEERAEYLCQDVDTVLFGSIALSHMGGQLRPPFCAAAKYRNSPKGLFTQASINRRLVTKMWIGHMVIVQMLTSPTFHVEQHSFTKLLSCCCVWFSLISFRWGLTEERAKYLCQDVGPFSLELLFGQMRGQTLLPVCECGFNLGARGFHFLKPTNAALKGAHSRCWTLC